MKLAKEIQKENLRAAAQKKKEEALEKTEIAIKQLIKHGKKINVSTVAKEANVSIIYLYKYPEIKQRMENLTALHRHCHDQIHGGKGNLSTQLSTHAKG